MSNQRKKVLLAVSGSLGLHVLVLLAWACTVQWLPAAQRTPGRTAKPLKLIVEEPTPAPTPESFAVVMPPVSTPTPLPFLDTASMPEAATPPPEVRAESAKNTVDASELPATGDAPVPTQDGQKTTSFALATHDYVAGEERGNAPPVSTPAPETAPPLPRVAGQPKPTAPVAAATPPPRLGDFALAAPRSIPTEPEAVPEESNPYDPSVRNTEPPMPTPVSVFGQSRGTYRPQETKTAIRGSINNRGPSSLASVNTPTGRYQAAVMEAIRRRWSRYISNRSDVASIGSVKIHFLVGMDGHARSTQIVTNTANEALASISLQAIADAAIPPMPADAIPNTGGGQLPVEITFEFLE